MLLLDSSLQEPVRLPGVVRAVEGRGHRRQHAASATGCSGIDLELAEHRDHQHLRRADQLAAARDQGVRLLPGAAKWTCMLGGDVLRATADGRITPFRSYTNAPAEPAESTPDGRFSSSRAAPSGTTSSTRSTCGRRRRSGSGAPLRRLCRHRQPVQHRDGDDAAGARIRARRSRARRCSTRRRPPCRARVR